MKQHNVYQWHLLVAGVAALVAASIVALGSLSRAQVTQAQIDSCKTACEADTDPNMPDPKDCAGWCQDGDYKSAPSGDVAPAPQQEDPCAQAHNYQGDRCTKEQMLLKYGCVPDISPECKGGSTGTQSGGQPYPSQEQQGPTLEQINQALRDNNSGVCFVGDRWSGNSSPLECAKNFGQWHGPYTQPSGQYHGAPDMGQGGIQRGPGGMMGGPGGMDGRPGRGGQMGPGGFGPGMMGPGGPGGGHMDCDRMEQMLEKMQAQLAKIDQKFDQMKAQMKTRVYGKVTKLQTKKEDALIDAETPEEEARISTKYDKKITKAQKVADKRYPQMVQSLDERKAEAEGRMQEGLTNIEEALDQCQEMEDQDFGGGGEFDGGGFDGGGFNGGPGYGPPAQFGF